MTGQRGSVTSHIVDPCPAHTPIMPSHIDTSDVHSIGVGSSSPKPLSSLPWNETPPTEFSASSCKLRAACLRPFREWLNRDAEHIRVVSLPMCASYSATV